MMNERLKFLLSTMNVPEERKNDFPWLLRNLGIKNSNNPNYQEAIQLIKQILKKIILNKLFLKVYG